MMPCQPHFVFGYAHSICVGGHSYLTHHMQGTLRGLIHSFVLHQFLTNIAHPTRVLLRRMVLFYHMGLIEDEIPESGILSVSLISFCLTSMKQTQPHPICQTSTTLLG